VEFEKESPIILEEYMEYTQTYQEKP
jgi:hypothetical protein